MTLPNMLTALRMVLSIWFGVEYCRGNLLLAVFLFIIACLSDVLDGFIARRFNMVSNVGKLLDPISDKLMLIIGIGCLVYSRAVSIWFLYGLIIKEFALIIGGIYYLKKGIVVHSSKYGKAASVFFTVGIGCGIVGLPHLSIGVLTGAFCCSLFAVGYYSLYFSN